MKLFKIGLFIKFFILFILSINLQAQELELSSFIVSDNQTTISSKYNGYVEKIFVKEGDIVKKNSMLLKIDSKEISSSKSQLLISIQQAKLTYTINKNDLEKAKDDYARYKKLYEKEMISKSNFEQVELKMKNLEKRVSISNKQIKQLNEKIAEIQKQFKYLNIKAPNNAMVIAKHINEGELAVATTPLMTISDIDNLVIYLDVAENDLKYFRNKKDVLVSIESLDIRVKANIIAILPSSDINNNSFKVKIGFKSNNKNILPGMYAKVIVEQ